MRILSAALLLTFAAAAARAEEKPAEKPTPAPPIRLHLCAPYQVLTPDVYDAAHGPGPNYDARKFAQYVQSTPADPPLRTRPPAPTGNGVPPPSEPLTPAGKILEETARIQEAVKAEQQKHTEALTELDRKAADLQRQREKVIAESKGRLAKLGEMLALVKDKEARATPPADKLDAVLKKLEDLDRRLKAIEDRAK
jgi:hypothetical protein